MTICERLIEGESLRAICTDPVMPDKATVLSWISQNEQRLSPLMSFSTYTCIT
jgi:hypothetical protein